MKRQTAPRPAVGSATSIVTMDIMEKIGVYFPEAHLDAEKMTALAAVGYTELGFDNVMPLFSVCHEVAGLGCAMDWGSRDRMPDSRAPLCSRITDSVRIPSDWLKSPACTVALQSISLLKRRYGDDVAVVGKVFGPWTLGYHVYGIEEFLAATILEPDVIQRAMRRLIEVTVQFGVAQVEAGADALTLADHCTRDLCSPESYHKFLLNIHQELHERLPCPLILHICGDTADRIDLIRQTGIECFHFDSKVPVATARQLAGKQLALMGGTSNLRVIKAGTPEIIARDVAEKISSGIEIIGPECAVPLDAPWRNLKNLSEEVHRQCQPERCKS